MNSIFKIGVGRACITPPLNTLLYGYPRDRRAVSVHDDLNATAFAIETEDTKAILFSVDTCALSDVEICAMRKSISEKTGVLPENIHFSATHTHSGPCTHVSPGWGDADVSYLTDILYPGALKAAEEALSCLKDAVMGVGTTESTVGINRRQRTLDGKIDFGQNPWGLFNKEMTVLAFKDTEGNPIGTIVNYGTHGTAAGSNFEITRDWSGGMVDALEAECGGIAALFVGPLGDTGPRISNGRTGGTTRDAEILGAIAGVDAIRAYKSIKNFSTPNFKMLSHHVDLPYEPMPTYEEAKARLAELGDISTLRGPKMKRAAAYLKMIEMYENNVTRDDAFRFTQTVFAFNDVAFVTFPFEMFTEISYRIAEHSPFSKTLTLSIVDGSAAYFPPKSELLLGGYEVDMFKFFNGFAVIDDSDTIAVKESVSALNELKKK